MIKRNRSTESRCATSPGNGRLARLRRDVAARTVHLQLTLQRVALLAASTIALAYLAGCSSAPTSCDSSRDCSSLGLVCDLGENLCVECMTAADCLGAGEVCRTHTCTTVTTCVSSRECPGQVCDRDLGYCVDCAEDRDCAGEQICEAGFCIDPPTSCASDRECSAMAQVCDLARGVCADCVRDDDCPPSEVCRSNACVAGLMDAGPPRIDAGPPRIDAGPPRIDAGPPRIDAGPPRIDAGPGGTTPVGFACGSDGACVGGAICEQGVCSLVCAAPLDCPSGRGVSCIMYPGGRSHCTHECEPVGSTGCGAGLMCQPVLLTGSSWATRCFIEGTVASGGSCSSHTQCGAGYGCYQTGGFAGPECGPHCRFGSGDCGVCTFFGSGQPIVAGTEYGVCG